MKNDKLIQEESVCLALTKRSSNGVKAAKASGSLCCALTTANTPEKLQEAGADIIAGGIDILYDPSKIIQGESKVEFS